MQRVFLLTVIAAFVFAFAAYADERDGTQQTGQPVLVELFANQNCPACPKAHKTMREVSAERDDVLVLTWVVDYWDYLGDDDPMAMPEANERQNAYADWLSLRAPYTPQSIYNGVKECPGPRRRQVVKNIEKLSRAESRDTSLTETDGLVSVIGNVGDTEMLYTVRYMNAEQNETGMCNPVVSITPLQGLQSVAHGCEEDCAVLLQSMETGEVVAFWQAD